LLCAFSTAKSDLPAFVARAILGAALHSLSNGYDIPEEVTRGPHSPAFRKFLSKWFYDTYAVTHGELDLTFLEDLTAEERQVARELIRRNLKTRHNHIIEGASALRDIEAVPTLKAMYDQEPDESRRLTIAGALWKLSKDPVFIECLERGKTAGSLGYFGLLYVLWLNDWRAVDYLIDLLPQKDRESPVWKWFLRVAFFPPLRPLLARTYIASRNACVDATGFYALSLLNQLEFGKSIMPRPERFKPPSYYRSRRSDPAFRESMTAAVRRWNKEIKNGWGNPEA